MARKKLSMRKTSEVARLSGCHWKPALESILEIHNFQLVQQAPGNNIYSVVRRRPGQPGAVLIDTLVFESAEEAVETAEAIRKIWRTDSSVAAVAVPSRRAVIIRASSSALAEIRHVLRSITPERSREQEAGQNGVKP